MGKREQRGDRGLRRRSRTPRNAAEELVCVGIQGCPESRPTRGAGPAGISRSCMDSLHTLTEGSAFSPVPHLFIAVLSVTLNLLTIHRKSVVLLAVFLVCRGLHVLFIDQRESREHQGPQGASTVVICEGGNKSQTRKQRYIAEDNTAQNRINLHPFHSNVFQKCGLFFFGKGYHGKIQIMPYFDCIV